MVDFESQLRKATEPLYRNAILLGRVDSTSICVPFLSDTPATTPAILRSIN